MTAGWGDVEDSRILRESPITLGRLVFFQYVQVGLQELDQDKLSPLLKLKYNNAIVDAVAGLGRPEEIGKVFSGLQKYLYQRVA
jgi:hypothetical protein